MSEYLVGPQDASEQAGTLHGEPGSDPATSTSTPSAGAATSTPRQLPPGQTQVRFGLPFNGVLPLWHDGEAITWHRLSDGSDPEQYLGFGYLTTVPGPSPTPDGWQEIVETGTLVVSEPDPETGESEYVLLLHGADADARTLLGDGGGGVPLSLTAPMKPHEAMSQPLNRDYMAIYVARLLLRAARDGAIALFTLRAPNDPDAHHLLTVPSSVDDTGTLHFNLGTLMNMRSGAWEAAHHEHDMSFLEQSVDYASLLTQDPATGESGFDTQAVIALGEPALQVLLAPGFPFALGYSLIAPTVPHAPSA